MARWCKCSKYYTFVTIWVCGSTKPKIMIFDDFGCSPQRGKTQPAGPDGLARVQYYSILPDTRYLEARYLGTKIPGKPASWLLGSSVWALWQFRKPRCALRFPKYRFWDAKMSIF